MMSYSPPSTRGSCSRLWKVSPDGADIRLQTEGLTHLVADLRAVRPQTRRAA